MNKLPVGCLAVLFVLYWLLNKLNNSGGVEDTRLEAKAKNTKKSKAKDSPTRGGVLEDTF